MSMLRKNINQVLIEMEISDTDIDADYNPQEAAAERFVEPPAAADVSAIDDVSLYAEDPSENSGEISSRRDSLYAAIKESGISGKTVFNLEDGLSQIREQAAIIGKHIEEFRASQNVVRNLSGDDLVTALANSIVRLKLYFWYTLGIYQEKVHHTGKLDAQTTMGALWKPNRYQLGDLRSIFAQMPDDFKQIVFSKNDFLTQHLRIAESTISKTINKLLEAEGFQSSETMDLDSNTEDFAINYLFSYAFQMLVKQYSDASLADIDKIDERIFKYFSNPFHVNTAIRTAKDVAMGKTKMQVNPDTGKRERVLNPARARGIIEPKVSDGDNEITNAIDQTVQDPSDAPISNATIDNLDLVTHSGETSKEAHDRPLIFSSDNFLIKYFNTLNYMSILGELLSRWSVNPGSKITYFNHNSLEMSETALLSLLFNDSDTYVDNTAVPLATLATDMLAESAELLVNITGQPISINENTISALSTMLAGGDGVTGLADKHGLSWFKIKGLPGRQKEYLRRYLKIEELPEFSVNDTAVLAGNSVKEKLIDRLKKEMLVPGAKTEVLKQIIAKMHLTDNPTELERLASIAGLSGYSIKNIRNLSPDAAEHKEKLAQTKSNDAELSKRVAASLYDKFAVFADGSMDKVFFYGGTTYNKKQLPAFVASLSGEELTKLWSDIKSGTLLTALNVPFMSLVSTGPGKKAVEALTANIEALLANKGGLTEGVITEGAVENASAILEAKYVEFFATEIAPILQQVLVEVKKLGPFLVSMIRLFEMYDEYLTKTKHKDSNLSNEELDEIEDLINFFKTGPNSQNFAAHKLRNQLRRELLPESVVTNIANAFEANKDNSLLVTPTADPVLRESLPSLKNWILTHFDTTGEYGFENAFLHLEKTGDVGRLRELLYANRDALSRVLYGGKLSKLVTEIIRGTYGSNNIQQKAPVETGADFVDPLAAFG